MVLRSSWKPGFARGNFAYYFEGEPVWEARVSPTVIPIYLFCNKILIFISDEDAEVVYRAIDALSQISLSSDGTQAVVNANVLEHLPELLESPSAKARKRTCVLMEKLAFHPGSIPAILAANPCGKLVSLLRQGYVRYCGIRNSSQVVK